MAKRAIENLTITDLQRELKRRERKIGTHVNRLAGKRERLRKQLANIEAEIAKYGGRISGAPGARKRAQNKMNLADALAKTLKSATMSVTDVAEAVQEGGYRTTSPNFRTIVNQTLIKDSRFKRVGRGQYTTK